MDNPEGRYHRASWLPVIAADILPIVRLDIRNERIHILDILHVDDSPDLLELFGSHQHVTCSRYGINDIHGRPAMFLDGLPEIVGKFGRHRFLPRRKPRPSRLGRSRVNSISNKRFAERIFVPVGTMDREAVAGMDGHLADLEVLAEPDRDSAGMEPLVLPGGDDRLHDVAGTVPFLELLPRSVPDREAVRVRPAAVPLAVPIR